MRLSMLCCFFAVSCCLLFPAEQAAGEGLYKYIDKRGVVHYTNIPADERYKPVKRSSSSIRIKNSETYSRRAHRTLRRDSRKYRSSFDQHIRHAARVHKVDPMLVKAVIKAESDFNRYAKSSKGAQGLMQLMPATAKYLKVRDPFDPWQNIYGGTKYLRELLDSFDGNLRLSLAAYNAGPTRVKRLKAVPRIPETVAYVGKVLRQYKAYKKNKRKQSYALGKTNIRVREMVTIN